MSNPKCGAGNSNAGRRSGRTSTEDHIEGQTDIGNLAFGNGRQEAPGILRRLPGKLVQARRETIDDLDLGQRSRAAHPSAQLNHNRVG